MDNRPEDDGQSVCCGRFLWHCSHVCSGRKCCEIMFNEKHKVIHPLRLTAFSPFSPFPQLSFWLPPWLVTHIHFASIQAAPSRAGKKSTQRMTTGCCRFGRLLAFLAAIKFPNRAQLKQNDAITNRSENKLHGEKWIQIKANNENYSI